MRILEDGKFFENWQSAVTAVRALQITSANRIFKQLAPHLRGPHELLPSERYFILGGNPFAENFDFNNNGVIEDEGYDYTSTRSIFNSRFPTLPYDANQTFHNAAQDDWGNDVSGVEYYKLYGEQKRKLPLFK